MHTIFSVVENGLITSDRYGTDTGDEIQVLPDSAFQALRQLAFSDNETDLLLTLTVKKGQEYVRFRNYIGLLGLADGTQLEILPKIGAPAESRTTLLRMLRHLRNSPFRTLPNARTGPSRLPLWEVFIAAFLDALVPLMRQGIQQAYVSVEASERFWKGKFQATRQQRDHAHHAERLAVCYDALTINIPPNRILKSALLFLNERSANATNRQRLGQMLHALADVPASDSVVADRIASRRTNRLFARYEPALRWAVALLGHRAFGVRQGAVTEQSLLFPMERVFEDYVAYGMRTYWPDEGVVSVQESSAHLVDEHVGSPKFKLRPDILIRQHGRTLLLDTKWKFVNGQEPGQGNYGIEQADLYQLFAYGKKYAADDLFLIYPTNETFRQPLARFGYDASTRLHVIPFDPSQPLASEVEKLAKYALS
ncbi:5-methylcytosine-specific restriction enzyme subunit McrC [Spirosoma lacussanchae]|uniref:McrC family protein n=1 Tax=Spirosoma lacussanchae TaxID=1884249 RepID=UPI001109005D|nr:McrC family protein [Spirosoma lacussanchae]